MRGGVPVSLAFKNSTDAETTAALVGYVFAEVDAVTARIVGTFGLTGCETGIKGPDAYRANLAFVLGRLYRAVKFAEAAEAVMARSAYYGNDP